MAWLLKHTWFQLTLVVLSGIWALRVDHPMSWFVLGFNCGVALAVILFLISPYGRLRFPS